jgi:hypothetical protein
MMSSLKYAWAALHTAPGSAKRYETSNPSRTICRLVEISILNIINNLKWNIQVLIS